MNDFILMHLSSFSGLGIRNRSLLGTALLLSGMLMFFVNCIKQVNLIYVKETSQ